MSALFDFCFGKVIGEEGALSTDPNDPGNYVNGKLVGTKFGLSARANPTLDIANLTLAQAKNYYFIRYWTPVAGDTLPPNVALVVFDAGVNSGVKASVKWLQQVVGATADGLLGTETLNATFNYVAHYGSSALTVELLVKRALFDASLPTFKTYALGWFRRLFALPLAANDALDLVTPVPTAPTNAAVTLAAPKPRKAP